MRVLTPETLDDALAMLASDEAGPLVPMSGGTDLLVEWPRHLERHDHSYLDLSGLSELRAHRWDDQTLVLGGASTYWAIVTDPTARRELPLLVEAARQVGAIQIQTRGTWAGNIVNASPAADGVPVMMALDAVVVLRSSGGERTVALDDFYLGYKKLRSRPDELITEIRIPRFERDVQVFRKVGSRRAQAITKVGVALVRSERAGWRVVVNSMAETVRRCRTIERMLDDRASIGRPEDLFDAIDADVAPIDDIRSTASYRRRVMANLLYSDLRAACDWIE